MAEASLSTGFLDLLRRFPRAYEAVRRIHSTLVRAATETLRACTKGFTRLGPPAATVCLTDEIRRKQVEGRVLLEAQPFTEPAPGSVLARTAGTSKGFIPGR